jgi:hypothetical protein
MNEIEVESFNLHHGIADATKAPSDGSSVRRRRMNHGVSATNACDTILIFFQHE